MELVEFLCRRLDDDERAARAAAHRDGEHWEASDDGEVYDPHTGGNGYVATGPWGGSLFETGEHIARHDPARVLREVEGKRRIIEMWFNPALPHGAVDGRDPDERETDEAIAAAISEVLRLLALPYADHPSYRPEWQPSPNP